MRIYRQRERDIFEPITTVFEVSGNIITLLGSPINRDFFDVFSKKKFLRDNCVSKFLGVILGVTFNSNKIC